MKEYNKPYIEDEKIELEDIVASSSPQVDNLTSGFEQPEILPFN